MNQLGVLSIFFLCYLPLSRSDGSTRKIASLDLPTSQEFNCPDLKIEAVLYLVLFLLWSEDLTSKLYSTSFVWVLCTWSNWVVVVSNLCSDWFFHYRKLNCLHQSHLILLYCLPSRERIFFIFLKDYTQCCRI